MKRRVLARRKIGRDIVLTESINDANLRKFTATILGFRNWHIATVDWTNTQVSSGDGYDSITAKCREIHDCIASGNETIFNEHGPFLAFLTHTEAR